METHSKEIRGTTKADAAGAEESRNFNQLNVQSTEYGITLSSVRIGEKANEIPAAQWILRKLDLRGCVVTADTLNTQKETVKAIVNDAHADYCLALKANHKCSYDDVVEYFNDKEICKVLISSNGGCYLREAEENGRRRIVREYLVSDDIKWFKDANGWDSLRGIEYERKAILDKKSGKRTIESRYFITSLPADAALFATVLRRHWHVENLLHWILDVAFREDKLRIKDKNALENLILIRRFIISILKILKAYYNLSYEKIRRKIGRRFTQEMPLIFATLKRLYGVAES